MIRRFGAPAGGRRNSIPSMSVLNGFLAILTQGSAGPDVAEAQCLLRRAGFPPGDIDGVYGDLTERAVKRLQARAGLVIDGKVGPYTWGALRG